LTGWCWRGENREACNTKTLQRPAGVKSGENITTGMTKIRYGLLLFMDPFLYFVSSAKMAYRDNSSNRSCHPTVARKMCKRARSFSYRHNDNLPEGLVPQRRPTRPTQKVVRCSERTDRSLWMAVKGRPHQSIHITTENEGHGNSQRGTPKSRGPFECRGFRLPVRPFGVKRHPTQKRALHGGEKISARPLFSSATAESR